MGNSVNVLVFPAGEINSVELHQALNTNVNIKLYGASSVERHGAYLFERYISNVPLISEPYFLETFNQILKAHKIDLIFPTHDSVTLYLAEHRPELAANVISADLRTCQICRDKKATYDLFVEETFCPRVYTRFDNFPLFFKPRTGQGGVGASVVHTKKDIPQDIEYSAHVITEYLPGKELTVDCLTDASGLLKAVLPRTRDRTLAGISVAGRAIDATQEVLEIATVINRKLNFMGLWYFQVKQDANGVFKLLEISSRCAGGMCLSRARGVNLPLLSVYVALGKEIQVFENPYTIKMDRTLLTRYKFDYDYNVVYIDYDDTIIVNGKVCLPVIQFLYQCKNEEKKVILLTRHEVDHTNTLYDDLKRFSIDEGLFSEITRVPENKEKNEYIKKAQAIFIDNSFKERFLVYNKCGIPVFDVEGIQVLN